MRYLLMWLTLLWPLAGLAEPLEVFVSVLPQETFVARVGGEHVKVSALTRPGQSPETFEPTPQQVAALARAELFVGIGMPFEQAWMPRLRAANPRMRVLDAREGIDLLPLDHHGHDEDPGHAGQVPTAEEAGDPHLWTSPLLAARMSASIRDTLTELDPAHAEDYARNQAQFAAELEALDQEIRAQLKELPSRKFLVFHPAWSYFADAYGLTQVPIELGGKEPGARTLVTLIGQAKRDQIRVVFIQPQSDPRFAEQIARAIGGRVIAIDPLAPDYVANLREVARQIAAAGTANP
ncbi:MAG: zinc ABC transporter substrate-binding protein [Chromatiaceae bacterium]|nr:zinc ABC transporter substrate-binding protein [Chromatiaceae bacterium]